MIYLLGGVLDQSLGVAFAAGARFRADIDEVPGVVIVLAEDVVFGGVQQGEEFFKEALLAFFGEFPIEAVHTAPEHGAEVVHGVVGRHPVCFERVALVGLLVIPTHLLTWVHLAAGIWRGDDG